MQYNDDAIATNESINNMQEYYAKLGKVSALKNETQTKIWEDMPIHSLYTQEIEVLNNLSNHAQNNNIKQYLKGLAQKSDAELNKLVQDYPEIDTSLDDNPIFYNRSNSSANFKKFLDIDLDIIDNLANAMQVIDKTQNREVLFKFVNRHIHALQQLFNLMHLLTFY